jgi:hypothetical protein
VRVRISFYQKGESCARANSPSCEAADVDKPEATLLGALGNDAVLIRGACAAGQYFSIKAEFEFRVETNAIAPSVVRRRFAVRKLCLLVTQGSQSLALAYLHLLLRSLLS